jgi:hypothetical protein
LPGKYRAATTARGSLKKVDVRFQWRRSGPALRWSPAISRWIGLRHATQPLTHREKFPARMVQRNGKRDWIRQTRAGAELTEQHSR